jgi:hypothetical protein
LDIQKVEDIVTQVVRREIRLSILQFAVGFLAGKLTTLHRFVVQKKLQRDINQSFQKKLLSIEQDQKKLLTELNKD